MNIKQIPPVFWQGAGLVLAGIVLYQLVKREAGAALTAVGKAVDPTSDKNLFYSGANAVGSAVSGRDDWTFGTWLAGLVHDDADAAAIQGPGFGATPSGTAQEPIPLRRQQEYSNVPGANRGPGDDRADQAVR